MLEDIPKHQLINIIGSLRKENATLRKERTEFASQNTLLTTRYGLARLEVEYANLACSARTDSSLFHMTFDFFKHYANPGEFYGVVHVCNHKSCLEMIGQWGEPQPASADFCAALTEPFLQRVVKKPIVTTYEIGKDPRFDEFSRGSPNFAGTTVMTVPLIPCDNVLVGALFIYKRGEQLFSTRERRIAEIFVQPAGIATMRID